MPEQITVNSYDIARSRADFLIGMGLDAKRPTAWDQYGYKQTLSFADFKAAYDRGGAGHGAVHRLLDKCWLKLPRIKGPDSDDETPWETKLAKLLKELGAWQKLRDFDRRNMVGRFAALIYRVADGQKLNQPLVKATKLVNIVPVYEDQIQVTKWQEDQTAEDYGQPLMFQIRTRSPQSATDTQAKPETWLDVHPSRVQILAEGSVGDFFDGVPLLQAGFNNLVDIEKISGGGAEGALKNSARTVVVTFEGESQPEVAVNPDGTASTKSVREIIEQQAKALNRNQDSSMVLQGGKAETLQTQVANLGPQFEIAANLFAASVQIPFTILFGQQTGRLASDEDKADMNARCASRQANELTPMLEQFIRRMQAAGIVDEGEFEIEWPDLGAPTDEQKIAQAKAMAEINKTVFEGGGNEPPFDGEEIRKAAGYEQREKGEGDDFKEDEPDPEPLPGDPVGKPTPKPGAKPASK